MASPTAAKKTEDKKAASPKKAESKKKVVIPKLSAGDSVKVGMRIVEGEKERVQTFQGVVIKVHPGPDGGNFTVRRVAYGVGVERTFPIASPLIARVELVRHGKVRRARLFYLRALSGKAARIKERRLSREKLAMIEEAGASVEEPTPVEAVEPVATAEATATPETIEKAK